MAPVWISCRAWLGLPLSRPRHPAGSEARPCGLHRVMAECAEERQALHLHGRRTCTACRRLSAWLAATRRGAGAGRCVCGPFREVSEMSLPRFIEIDGRRYLWRELVAPPRPGDAARAAADPVSATRGLPPARRAQRRRALPRAEPVHRAGAGGVTALAIFCPASAVACSWGAPPPQGHPRVTEPWPGGLADADACCSTASSPIRLCPPCASRLARPYSMTYLRNLRRRDKLTSHEYNHTHYTRGRRGL